MVTSVCIVPTIFLGKITTWNDPSIQRLNPSAKLPSLRITVVHRSDSSGTSYIFTDYLSRVNTVWKGQVGASKSPNWPSGVGGKGNLGVAQLVSQTPGAVGYVELAYILQTQMTQAAVQNRSGKFLEATLGGVSASAARFPHVSAQHFSIVDAPGPSSYPICGYSWVMLFRHQPSAHNAKAVVGLIRWTENTGQQYAQALGYAPLPTAVRSLANRDLAAVSG